MSQYIDKSALIVEIERRISALKANKSIISMLTGGMFVNEFKDLLSFLDTLEVKETKNFIWNNARTTVPEDSTNQIICIKEDGLAVPTIGKIVDGTVKWAYLDDLLNTNSFNAEVKEVDLEKEFDKCCENYIFDDECEVYTAKRFFKLGFKAQKGE